MSSLYEINAQIEELTEHLIDADTGELDEEVLAQLEQLDMDLDAKLENYGLVMKQLQAESDALMEESKALKRRAEVKLNKIDRMGELVKKILGGKPKEFTRVKFGFRKSERVEIVNEDIVPDELCIFKTEKKPDKKEIKRLLKEDMEVPGCTLAVSQNLQVR